MVQPIRTKLTPKLMRSAGFKQTDWFYDLEVNGKEFTIGFLFFKTLNPEVEFDSVDIFYDEKKLYSISMAYTDQLEKYFTEFTGEKLDFCKIKT